MVAKKQKKHHKKLFSRAGTEKQTRSLFGNAVLFIILAAFGAFMILPLFYSVINSFKPVRGAVSLPAALLRYAAGVFKLHLAFQAYK